jgi:WD repeat-containing protein 23
MQLLGHAGLGQLFALDYTSRPRRRNPYFTFDSDDEPESGDAGSDSAGPRKKRLRGRAAFQKVPSEEGRILMNSGTFGTNPRSTDSTRRKKRLQYRIMQRELGLGGSGRQKNVNSLMKQELIPGTAADTIIHYNARCYSGQFSDDGNFFFSCAQDFRVRMYDTSNPYNWKYYKVCTKDFPPIANLCSQLIDCSISWWTMDYHRCFTKSRQSLSCIQLNPKYSVLSTNGS